MGPNHNNIRLLSYSHGHIHHTSVFLHYFMSLCILMHKYKEKKIAAYINTTNTGSSSSYLPSLCLGQTEKVDLLADIIMIVPAVHTKVDLQTVQRAYGVMDIFMLLSA